MSKPLSATPDAADLGATLARIAAALERLARRRRRSPISPAPTPSSGAPTGALAPVVKVNRVELALLRGIDRARDTLLDNTERFARGLPANNALLWGARGMGKSSLVKAVHAEINRRSRQRQKAPLKLVEIHREDIESLPALMALIREAPYPFIIFCDDLSFDARRYDL